jgi:murein DD-endopeptidase MepM/ murein hydrolase activator NlpD
MILKPLVSSFVDRLPTRLHAAAQALHHHRRGVSAAVLTLLAGFGVTAFGIAPLAPDAADLPVRTIAEPVTHDVLDSQLEALAGLQLALTRSDVTRPGDSADSLLRRLGIQDRDAANWLRNDPVAKQLLDGRAGKMVTATVSPQRTLKSLVARYPIAGDDNNDQRFSRLTVETQGKGWVARQETGELQSTSRLASGTIVSSLFAATDESGIPDAVAVQIAEIFGTDIDFRRELRKGDTFSVVFETLTADGEPISWNQGSGRVLATEFINNGKTYQAAWFGEGKGGYFDFDGQSKRRSFLASPMEFSRVTSGFKMRFHPIQKIWKAHLGVDYGAPTGTPVRSVGDATVSFAGVQNGYGNVVQLQHSGDRMTVYAHLSRIDVRKGQRVSQGQRIGAVGSTGWATGPHLHFEFRVSGKQMDPLVIAKSSETITLSPQQRPAFLKSAQVLKQQLALADDLNGMPGRVE